MLPYFILVFLPILVYLFGKVKKINLNKFSIFFYFIILFLILTFRAIECGTDLKNYYFYFNTLHFNSFADFLNSSNFDTEFLFNVFNKFCYMISNNFHFYLFIVALVSLLPIFFLYYYESKNAPLTIILFTCLFPISIYFSAIRQIIAIAIVVVSYKFIKEKKFLVFLFLIFFASLFHRSALFMVILYPLYYLNISKKHLFIFLFILFFVFMFKNSIFIYFLNYLFPIYQERYSVITSTGSYFFFLVLLFFTVISLLLPSSNKLDKNTIGLRNFLIFSTYLQCFSSISTVIMRINYYFLIFVPILLPNILSCCSLKNKKIVNLFSILFSVFLIIYFFYKAYFGDDILNIFPYVSYFKGGF